jgi:hypothetical protein
MASHGNVTNDHPYGYQKEEYYNENNQMKQIPQIPQIPQITQSQRDHLQMVQQQMRQQMQPTQQQIQQQMQQHMYEHMQQQIQQQMYEQMYEQIYEHMQQQMQQQMQQPIVSLPIEKKTVSLPIEKKTVSLPIEKNEWIVVSLNKKVVSTQDSLKDWEKKTQFMKSNAPTFGGSPPYNYIYGNWCDSKSNIYVPQQHIKKQLMDNRIKLECWVYPPNIDGDLLKMVSKILIQVEDKTALFKVDVVYDDQILQVRKYFGSTDYAWFLSDPSKKVVKQVNCLDPEDFPDILGSGISLPDHVEQNTQSSVVVTVIAEKIEVVTPFYNVKPVLQFAPEVQSKSKTMEVSINKINRLAEETHHKNCNQIMNFLQYHRENNSPKSFLILKDIKELDPDTYDLTNDMLDMLTFDDVYEIQCMIGFVEIAQRYGWTNALEMDELSRTNDSTYFEGDWMLVKSQKHYTSGIRKPRHVPRFQIVTKSPSNEVTQKEFIKKTSGINKKINKEEKKKLETDLKDTLFKNNSIGTMSSFWRK